MLIFPRGLIVLFNGIPFIYNDDDTFSTLMCDSCDLGILLSYSFCRIDHNQDHIRSFYCRNCTNNTVALQFLFDLILTAKSCCINEYILFSIVHYFRVNGISCSSGNIGYDHTVFSDQTVDDRRLPNVRLPNDCNSRTVIFLFLACPFRKICQNLIQHISDSNSFRC